MTMHVDDYNHLDVSYIIQAFLLNPCDHEDHAEIHDEWSIALLLGIGKKGYKTSMAYPTRQLRDDAFEKIGMLLKPTAAPVGE